MSSIKYQIVHQIPGRMRIKIPQKLQDLQFSRRLEQKLITILGVTQVELDIVASSVTINFAENQLSETILQEKLAIALEEAGQTTPDRQITNPQFFVTIILEDNLIPYEREQLELIYQWRLEEPSTLTTFISQLFSPIQAISENLITGGIVDQVLTLCDKCASEWQTEWEDLQRQTQARQPEDLRQFPLEKCDRLASQVQVWAVGIASTRGGLLALFKEAGVIAEIPLAIALSLKTIHQIGLCYGITPETQVERLFAWIILAIATSQTPEEKQAAFSALYHIHDKLDRLVFGEMLEEMVEDELFSSMRESVLHQAMRYLAEDFSLENIPLISIAVGVVANETFMTQVSEIAHHIFQMRWLLNNHKIKLDRQPFTKSL